MSTELDRAEECLCEPHAEPPTSGYNPRCPVHRLSTLELAALERDYQRAQAKAEVALARRNVAIYDASRSGRTHAEIARATGLSRGRIGQLLR